MDNIERNSKKGKKELRLVNSFLQTKNVNRELQTRIRNYLEYMHREEKQLNLEETQVVIAKLSDQLRQELTKEVNQQYIQKFHILKNIFSRKVQEKSLFIMHDQKFTPGENIFSEGDSDDQSIYLVWEGSVDIYHTNQRQEDYLVSTISAGQCFGEIAFFTGTTRTASARSSQFTSVISINRKEFMYLLKEHSHDDYEVFMQIAHLIEQSQDYSLIYEKDSKQGKCFTCGSQTHISKHCTLTHFSPKPIAVVMTAMRSFAQERQVNWIRKMPQIKWYALNYANIIKQDEAAHKIEETYTSKIEELNDYLFDFSESEIEQSQQFYAQHNHQVLQQQQYQQAALHNSLERSATAGGVHASFLHEDFNSTGRVEIYPQILPTRQNFDSVKEIPNRRHADTSNAYKLDVNRKQSKYAGAGVASNNNNNNNSVSPLLHNTSSGNTMTHIHDNVVVAPIMEELDGNASGLFGSGMHITPSQQMIPLGGGLGVATSILTGGQISPSPLGFNAMQSRRNSGILMRKYKKTGTLLTPASTARGRAPTTITAIMSQQKMESGFAYQRNTTGQVIMEDDEIQAEATEQQKKLMAMRQSFANLFEAYGKNVSLHIDFMRNYNKYFPKFNIDEIERSAIIGAKYGIMADADGLNSKLGYPIKKSNTFKKQNTNKRKFQPRQSLLQVGTIVQDIPNRKAKK